MIDKITYELTAETKGFKLYKRTGITLETNQPARTDITLEVGVASETVNVSPAENRRLFGA